MIFSIMFFCICLVHLYQKHMIIFCKCICIRSACVCGYNGNIGVTIITLVGLKLGTRLT